jgi:hypothetical protein
MRIILQGLSLGDAFMGKTGVRIILNNLKYCASLSFGRISYECNCDNY